MIVGMVAARMEHCEEYALVLRRRVNVTQLIVSTTHWCHGVYHILATDTITGLVCMVGSSGMVSLALQLPTLSPWENRCVEQSDCIVLLTVSCLRVECFTLSNIGW